MNKTIAVGAALLVTFGAGWTLNDWRRDSIDLAIEYAAKQSAKESERLAAQSARQLEDMLQEIRGYEFKHETIIQKEIIKPVFTSICASDEFVRMFNDATAEYEQTLSGKLTDKMPD